MKKYPSKISYGVVILIMSAFIGASIPIISPPLWSGLIIIILAFGFITHLFLTTHYLIDGSLLVVRSGLVVNKGIDINSIRLVSETNSIIGAPAASFDRLRIDYGKHGSILIAPKDKSGFIEHLTSINPNIEININRERSSKI